jgi:hypothetical protein
MRGLAFILLCLLAATAQAAPPTGSRIDPVPKAPEGTFRETPQDAAKVLNGYARCVADVRPKFADEILALPLSSREQEAALRKGLGGHDDCLGMNVAYLKVHTPAALIGGMAEERFVAENRGKDFAAVIGASKAEPRNVMEDIALCLVRRNPSGAVALIGTSPGTPAEKSAVRTLVPDLGPCVPQGTTVKLNELTVRVWIAAGLYHAARGTVPAAVN